MCKQINFQEFIQSLNQLTNEDVRLNCNGKLSLSPITLPDLSFASYPHGYTVLYSEGKEKGNFYKDNITEITMNEEEYLSFCVSFNDGTYFILSQIPKQYLKCDKCNKEFIDKTETIWMICGTANYGSHFDSFDNESQNDLKSLKICDNCIFDFVGEVEIGGDSDDE